MIPELTFANGISIDISADDEVFRGLGEIRCGGTVLRNAARPMFVDIRNPWGVQLRDFRVASCDPVGDGYQLAFEMNREQGGPMDWQLHECRPVRYIGDWTQGPQPATDTTLSLEMHPVSRRIGDRDYQGFSYQYIYRSDSVPIYMLLDRSTWELEGSTLASELWMRQGNAPPVYQPSGVEEHYSTEWFLPTCGNPNVFQFLPFQTHLQGFTMTAGEAGILFTWSPRVSHIRSLFEKPRGTDLFVHLHEHCGDLADELTTAPMEVLFAPGPSDRVQRANACGDMMELAYDTLHADIGFRREYLPTYGQIEEWGDADLDLYRREGIPALAEAGARYVELANHCQNNMNTWGISNMCCTVDYKIAGTAGEENLQRLCRDAADQEVRIGMWANTSIASTTVQFDQRSGDPKRIDFLPREDSIMAALKEAERPFVRNSYGAIEADHYTPVFCVLNLRDPAVRGYWLENWRHLREHVGLGGVFLDSSFNLSSDKFDWRFSARPGSDAGATDDQTHLHGNVRPTETPPASIESQYHAHLTLMIEMQKMGYLYCGEDSGVFGVHRNGPAIETRLSNLPMWREFIAGFDADAIRRAGADPDDVFFRGLAYRLMWTLCWVPSARCLSFHPYRADTPENAPREWHFDLYHAYNAVEPFMRRRRILPDEAGVLYQHEDRRVLWAFSDFAFDLGQDRLIEELPGASRRQTKTIEARQHRVYVIHPEDSPSNG